MKQGFEQKRRVNLSKCGKSRIKVLIPLILLVLGLISVFAVTETIDSFYNQDNPFDITFAGGDNQSYYLQVPKYAYVENVSLLINIINYFEGFENADLSDYFGNGGAAVQSNIVRSGNYALSLEVTKNLEKTIINYTYHIINISIKVGDGGSNNADFALFKDKDSAISFARFLNIRLDKSANNVQLWNSSSTKSFPGTYSVGWNNFTLYINWSQKNATLYQENILLGSIGFDSTISHIDSYGFRVSGINNKGYFDDLYMSNINTSSKIAIGENNLIGFSNYENNSLNTTQINNILENNCPSPNYISGDYCMINFTFYLDTVGLLEVNLTNATYSYGIDNCSNSFGIPSNGTAFNLSARDQLTDSDINSNASFEISYLSQTYAASMEQTTHEFCNYPAWFNETGNIYASIDSTGYNPYTFNRFDILFNGSAYFAYMLEEDADHVDISYRVIDVNNEPIENALFRVYRNIGGVPTLVFEEQTDITGQVSLYQDTTYKYDYAITAAGYPAKNFTLQPSEQASEPDYQIKLTTGDTSYFENPYEGIRYKHVPDDIIFNNSGKLVNISFILQGSNLEEVGMRFYDHNFTCVPASCEDIIYEENGGTVTVAINMTQVGSMTGAYWFKPKGGERIYVNDNKIKIVNFIESAGKKLTEVLQDLKDNTSPNQRTIMAAIISCVLIGLGAGLGMFGALLIIPAMIANITLSLPSIGLINPFVGMIMTIFGGVMFILFSMGNRTL